MVANEEMVEALLKDAYTREEIAQAVLALEDRDDTPDLRAAKRVLKTLPVLTLYVSRALSAESVRRIGQWVRREIDPRALLEIHIDPHAGGGCLFAWKGVLHDYSLVRGLKEKQAAYQERIAHALTTQP